MITLDDSVLTVAQKREDTEPRRLAAWYDRFCDSISDFFGRVTSEEYAALGTRAKPRPSSRSSRLSLCYDGFFTPFRVVAHYERFCDSISDFFERITSDD